MKIALAPYAAKLPTGSRNPKDYPYFAEVVALLNANEHEVIQLGVKGENRIEGVSQFIQSWPLGKLVEVVQDCDSWVSVDTWLPHFCWLHRLRPGVVIWGQSDSRIWGHPENVNLTKSPVYLRQYQFAPWYEAVFNPEAFVEPEEVVRAVDELVLSKVA